MIVLYCIFVYLYDELHSYGLVYDIMCSTQIYLSIDLFYPFTRTWLNQSGWNFAYISLMLTQNWYNNYSREIFSIFKIYYVKNLNKDYFRRFYQFIQFNIFYDWLLLSYLKPLKSLNMLCLISQKTCNHFW